MAEHSAPLLDGPQWGPASGGTPRQLVVLLHGVGADGNDLIDLAPHWGRAVPDALFISVHAPFPFDMAPHGRQWFSLADREDKARLAAGIRVAADYLNRFLDAKLAALKLPPSACAIMGFSQGAMTSLFGGLRRAEPLAGILAYSGALLDPESLAAEITARPPVLLVHGEADGVVPVEHGRAAVAAMRAEGVDVAEQYSPRLAHGIDDAGLSAGALFLQKVFSAQ